jgi:hypothetical protein
MAVQRTYNSTNVRFISVLLMGAGASCASAPPLPQHKSSRACEAGRLLVCEEFGLEKQCTCTPRREIDALLATFAAPAWFGGRP